MGNKQPLKFLKNDWVQLICATGICLLIIFCVYTSFFGMHAQKEGFNEDNLEGLGFKVVYGHYVSSASVVAIDKPGSFVFVARNYNVTIVFLSTSYNLAWFTYDGIIYKYEW